MKKRRTPKLVDLQERFRLDVVFGEDSDARALPCWFADHDDRPCDGPMRAAHWLKRQRVRNALWALGLAPELIELAEWDIRNAVCSCGVHDDRHDGRMMPPLEIPASAVPLDVAFFALDWGLEFELERRSPEQPPLLPCVSINHQHAPFLNTERLSSLAVARSERALLG